MALTWQSLRLRLVTSARLGARQSPSLSRLVCSISSVLRPGKLYLRSLRPFAWSVTLRHGSDFVTSSPDTTRPSCHNRTRPRRSCKVPRSPRNDSLLRTVLPLQHLAHVRHAVRVSNRIDTPSVDSTCRHNREYRSTNYDRPQLPTMIIQLHSTTRPTSAFSFDHPVVFFDSSDLSFQL